jgi:HSP20 family molecular chaperone IbpA
MTEDSKQKLIEEFNNKIRRQYDQKSGKWYFSIVDIITITINSSDPRNYWKVLKNRLKKTQNELVTACNQLKMEASDGKFYLTDTAEGDTITKLLKIISPTVIPYFESYLDDLESPKSENIVSLIKDRFEPKENPNKDLKNVYQSYPHKEEEDAEFMISIDMYRKKNFLIVEVFIAGVSLSDLNIIATSQTLSIKGRREILNNIEEGNYQIKEISWGKFYRNIDLPYEVDINKIEALDKNGLVTILMPIIDKFYTRRIKIKSL